MNDPTRLRKWQAEAVDAAEAALSGDSRPVIQAVMGAGKSITISELAGRAFKYGRHVVITCPTQELVRQLTDTVTMWTGQNVGMWYADKHDLWPMTVVCQMSLAGYEEAWRAKYSITDPITGVAELPKRLWIADECHKTECETVLSWSAPAKRIGFTATPWRAEERESITSFDEVVYEYSADKAFKDGHVVKPTLHHLSECKDLDDAVAEWAEQARQQWGGGVINASSIADAEAFASRLDAITVHSESPNDADMARAVIRDGGIVVYVDMLAEGFDCPEIMWMALRRPVGSRVRFAQEVGRGLRACKRLGKTTCHQLDVHDLWGVHAIDWQAALGEIDSMAVPALQLDWAIEQTGWSGGGSSAREEMPPELLSPLRSWLRHERVQAAFDGRISIKEIGSRSWRSDPCSRKQLEYLDDLMRRVDPSRLDTGLVQRVRTARAALVDCIKRDPSDLAGAFRKGDASDLIDVVRGMA